MSGAKIDPRGPQASAASRQSRTTAAILALCSVAGLAFLFSGMFVMLLVAWRLSILAWAIQLGLCATGVWFAVRGRSRWATITSLVALIATLALALFLVPVWRSMARHDARGRAIAAFVCAGDHLPAGSSLIACDSSISNPYNGNQCGYNVELRLDTAATKEELDRFYSNTPPAERFGDHIFRADPTVLVEVPGEQASVEVLLVGDEDLDVRCT